MLTTLTRVQSVEIQVRKTTTQTVVPMIYVAAPFSEPDPVANTKHAIRIADALLQAGFTPLVPHLTMLWDIVSPKSYEEWLDYDRELLARCDAVLRVPGYSVGATRETKLANWLDIPVIRPSSASSEDCVRAALNWQVFG